MNHPVKGPHRFLWNGIPITANQFASRIGEMNPKGWSGGHMNLLMIRLSTRKCRGCSDPEPHSHHLTAIGRRRYKP